MQLARNLSKTLLLAILTAQPAWGDECRCDDLECWRSRTASGTKESLSCAAKLLDTACTGGTLTTLHSLALAANVVATTFSIYKLAALDFDALKACYAAHPAQYGGNAAPNLTGKLTNTPAGACQRSEIAFMTSLIDTMNKSAALLPKLPVLKNTRAFQAQTFQCARNALETFATAAYATKDFMANANSAEWRSYVGTGSAATNTFKLGFSVAKGLLACFGDLQDSRALAVFGELTLLNNYFALANCGFRLAGASITLASNIGCLADDWRAIARQEKEICRRAKELVSQDPVTAACAAGLSPRAGIDVRSNQAAYCCLTSHGLRRLPERADVADWIQDDWRQWALKYIPNPYHPEYPYPAWHEYHEVLGASQCLSKLCVYKLYQQDARALSRANNGCTGAGQQDSLRTLLGRHASTLTPYCLTASGCK